MKFSLALANAVL